MNTKKALSCIFLAMCLISTASAEIRINEIMAKTPKAIYGSYCEWIELYSSEPANMSGWTIDTNGTGQQLNFSFYIQDFLIFTENKTAFLYSWDGEDSKIIEWKSIGLNDANDMVYLMSNNTIVSNFSYTNSNETLSWSLNSSGSWRLCDASPGEENICIEIEESNQTSNQTSQNSTQNQTSNQTSSQTNSTAAVPWINASIPVIYSSDEFEVEARIYNFNPTPYDIKIWIEHDNKAITEIYYEDKYNWKSGVYYLENAISGVNSSINLTLRLNKDYSNFEGNATFNIRLRQNGTIIKDFSKEVNILRGENTDNESQELEAQNSSENESTAQITGEVIYLNAQKTGAQKEEAVFLSKQELIKKYAIYGFAFLCVVFIIVLIINKL